MREYDLVIVGGGPAGLAAAAAAKDSGIDSILILERDRELGGILNQCIHNGFGLHTFKEELTGPEYAARFIERVRERKIEYKLNTMVMEISPQKAVTAMNREEGLFEIKARAVILAMGCRERSRGALNICGNGPAAGQYGRLHAWPGGGDLRIRRYRTHHGPAYDPGGRKGEGGGRADALFRRP